VNIACIPVGSVDQTTSAAAMIRIVLKNPPVADGDQNFLKSNCFLCHFLLRVLRNPKIQRGGTGAHRRHGRLKVACRRFAHFSILTTARIGDTGRGDAKFEDDFIRQIRGQKFLRAVLKPAGIRLQRPQGAVKLQKGRRMQLKRAGPRTSRRFPERNEKMGKTIKPRRKRRCSRLLFAAASSFPVVACAQTYNWNVGDGNWGTPTNWSPAEVPAMNDNAYIIDNSSSFTVNYDFLTPGVALNSLVVDNRGAGSNFVTLSFASTLAPSMSATAESVGIVGRGAIIQDSGTNTVSSTFQLGANAGSTGSYILGGTGTLTASCDEFVGDSLGAGTFIQSGGTNNLGAQGLILSGGTGSTGSYTLSGTGLLSAGEEAVGDVGAGSFVQSGGTNNVSAGLYIDGMNSTGSFTLSGTGSLSTYFELVGDTGAGSFIQSGGTNNSVYVVVGPYSDSTGSYSLSSTGSLAGEVEYVGSAGTATFTQSGGVNTAGTAVYVAYASGSEGSYILSGGEVWAPALYVGGSSSRAGGTGVYTVSQAGLLAVTGTLQVWNSGRANLDVPNTTVGNLIVAGNGIVNLNGGLTINYASPANDPVTSIVTYLQNGYNGGAWTGTSGIISTSVAAGSGKPVLSVGYADGNADNGTPAGPNQIIVQYTLAGDANLDGVVNSADLLAVIQNFNKTGTDWANGNFTYIAGGPSTTSADLLLVIQNFNQTLPPPAGSAVTLGGTTIPLNASVQSSDVPLPEPGGVAIAAIAAGGVLARRRRKEFSPPRARRAPRKK
jgi:hypothetical protein